MKKICIVLLLAVIITTSAFAETPSKLLIGGTSGFDFFFSSFGDELHFADYDLPILVSANYFFGQKRNIGVFCDLGISVGLKAINTDTGEDKKTNVKNILTVGGTYRTPDKKGISFLGSLGLQTYTDISKTKDADSETLLAVLNFECSLKAQVMFTLKDNLKLLAGLRGTVSFAEYYAGYVKEGSEKSKISTFSDGFYGLGVAPLVSLCVEL